VEKPDLNAQQVLVSLHYMYKFCRNCVNTVR